MENIPTNSIKAWTLAARPKTLSGAATPVILGCALAIKNGTFELIPAILCFLFAFAMQIDANFINDLFDYLKGSDRDDRLGPQRACAEGWITTAAMKRGIIFTTLLASTFGLYLLYYGSWEMLPIGMLCLIFAFLYTAGPYPLAYHGFGDILVLIFFGFIPVGCTYYIMSHSWNWEVGIISLSCGMIIDTLLMVNNYRDRKEDKLSGKKTLVVRLGEKAGERLYLILGIIASLLSLLFLINKEYYAAILPIIYIIPHIATWREMTHINKGKELNRVLGKTSRNMLLYGILMASGLILS